MALRAAAIESAMASRAKSEFLANMSHELRTPLNAIIGFGDLIEHLAPEERSAGKPREYASHISDAGKHLLGIVNDILNISRIESGNFDLDLRLLNLRDVVETSIHLAQTRITQKRQMLDVQIPDDLPFVLADELRLRQILINLLSNASKFTGESGSLCVAVSLDGPDAVAISVTDTGCGMSQEQTERAVEPFTQIHSTYSRQEEGTGLGLPIAKALVLRHGGNFYITSTPNVGTTVKFTLPTAVLDGAGTIAA